MNNNTYDGIERRRSQRAPYSVEIWYRDRNKAGQGFKHAYGKNISQHGLLFESYENFPTCTILEIKLGFPPLPGLSMPNSDSFMVLGEVVRCEGVIRSWLYHIGISFCKIDEEMRKFLGDYIIRTLELSSKPDLIDVDILPSK